MRVMTSPRRKEPSGVVVKRSAPGGAGPMLNPFFPDAMRRYMHWFEGPFAAAKPNLGALFQDSYEYKSQWAPDFFAQFEKLRAVSAISSLLVSKIPPSPAVIFLLIWKLNAPQLPSAPVPFPLHLVPQLWQASSTMAQS